MRILLIILLALQLKNSEYHTDFSIVPCVGIRYLGYSYPFECPNLDLSPPPRSPRLKISNFEENEREIPSAPSILISFVC